MKNQLWTQQGIIYKSDVFGTGYTQDPVVEKLSEEVWRIYYTSRSKNVQSYPFYIDVEAGNPRNIISEMNDPLLELGDLGTFDDNGITVTSIVRNGDQKYLYYCGWNRRVNSPYSLAIGLAVSSGPNSFEKYSKGPIIDRSIDHPIGFSAMLLKVVINWIWFISFTEWPKD